MSKYVTIDETPQPTTAWWKIGVTWYASLLRIVVGNLVY